MAEAKKGVVVKKGEIEKAPVRVVSPFDDLERTFDEFFGRGWLRPFGFRRPFAEIEFEGPRVDVIDRPEEVVVRAHVPGVKKEELEVSVSGNLLTLKGETRHEAKEEKGDFYRSEISYGAFARTLMLPAEVDEDKVTAALKDGVLELTMPKIEKAKRRTIKID